VPYKGPSAFEFDGLRAVVEAKAEPMKDHIWAMREDSIYFEGMVSSLSHTFPVDKNEKATSHEDLAR
jgi:predicted dinucleotide-utilizing enzyme